MKRTISLFLTVILVVILFAAVPLNNQVSASLGKPEYDSSMHYDVSYNMTATTNGDVYAEKNPNGYQIWSDTRIALASVEMSDIAINDNAEYYIKTYLSAGTICIENQNEKYMGPVLSFRKVTLDGVSGMLQLRFLKDCGGAALCFDTDYTAISDSYILKTFSYYDGRTALDTSSDMEIVVQSGVDFVKAWLNDVLCIEYHFSESQKGELVNNGVGVGTLFKYCTASFRELSVWTNKENGLSGAEDEFDVLTDYSSNNAYFHDQGGIYMSPLEPTASDDLTVRFRTPKTGIQWVSLQYTSSDTSDSNVAGGWYQWNPMTKNQSLSDDAFDIWEGTIPATSERYRYRFYIYTTNGKYYFFSNNGLTVVNPSLSYCYNVWPDFKTPDWSKGIYWYSAPPTAFYNGDALNDVAGDIVDLSNNSSMESLRYKATYGGDLAGIRKKLDYISELYCDGVYINPIWPSYDAVGYGSINNYMVDAQYGNEAELKKFISTLHNDGKYVMMDVLPHSVVDMNLWYNSYSKYPNVGAYQSQTSEFYDLFEFTTWPSDPVKFLSSIAFNLSNETAQNLIYKNEDSYLKRYLGASYDVDAYRVDSGAYLYGKDSDLNTITKAMTTELKKYAPNKLLVCENYALDSSTTHLEQGWDTAWNTSMIYALRNLATGDATMTSIKNSVANYVQSWPRAMALSMNIYTSTHDFPRLQNSASDTSIKMVRLFQMTMPGSPCMYYGDETNAIDTADSVAAFNWDRSEWDMDTFELTKALGKLRKDYTCLKDGVFKFGVTDNSKQVLSFARWNNDGTVVTLLNGKDTPQGYSFDVHQFGLSDGTALTDYLTGKEYVVRNGYISLSLPAGGTVLVTGAKTAGTYYEWNDTDFGETSAKVEMQADCSTFKLSGSGDVTGETDTCVFVNREMSGAFELSAEFSAIEGSAALAIRSNRSSSASGYTATVDFESKKIIVYYRSKNSVWPVLLTEKGFSGNSVNLKILRNGNNESTLYIYENNSWNAVENSTVQISMNAGIFGGIMPLRETVWVRNVSLSLFEGGLYDGFIENKTSAEFTVNSSNYIISDEKISFTGEDLSAYFTSGLNSDHTVRTELSGNTSDSGFAGIAFVSGNNGVFGGRYNGEICLARILDGNLVIYDSVEDKCADTPIELQLQKIGNHYSLSYRYIDKYDWQTFENRIFASLSEIEVGLISQNCTSSFDYVTIGDGIDAGTSLCTPITKRSDYLYDFSGLSAAAQMAKWSSKNGDWAHVTGGVKQKDSSARAYYYTQKAFSDFRAEVTAAPIDTSSGYVGIIFDSASGTSITDGYLLKLFADGRLQLLIKGNRIIAQTNVTLDSTEGSVRIIIERIGERILVYAGQEAVAAINITDSTYTSGYFGLMTNYCVGYFGNYNVFSLDSAWYENTDTYLNGGKASYSSASVSLDATSGNVAAVHEKGVGFTDLYAHTKLYYNGTGFAGLGFAAAQGKNILSEGVIVAVENNSDIVLYEKSLEKARISTDSMTIVNLSVSVEDGVYKVYVQNSLSPIITYKSSVYGGVVSVVSKGVKAYFSDFSVEDITGTVKENTSSFYSNEVSYANNNITALTEKEISGESISIIDGGFSATIANTSGYMTNEYVSFSEIPAGDNEDVIIEGVIKAGAGSLGNTNMQAYNAPVITFRKVDGGYLNIMMTAASGGASLCFSTGYASEDKYLKFFNYEDGTVIRENGSDKHFRIKSNNKTVSVWINDICVLDNYDYAGSYTGTAPAAAVSFKCCAATVSDFKIFTETDKVITLTDGDGALNVSNSTFTAGEKVTLTKSGVIKSGNLKVYYKVNDKIYNLTPVRDGYREDFAADTYSFNMPETTEPIVVSCEFEDNTDINISTLDAECEILDDVGTLKFTTRFGYEVSGSCFEIDGKKYTVVNTGTLVTTMTALNLVKGNHDELIRYNTEALWGDNIEYLANVNRTKYYDYCSEYIDFCAAVTDISAENFDKDYVARGYVTAKAENGEYTVFYSNIVYSSITDALLQ